MSRASQWEPISDAQLAALVKWRAEMGVSWRAKLLAAWECAGRGYSSYSPELQQLRNGWGPSWLVKFKIPPRTECEAPMSSARPATSRLLVQELAAETMPAAPITVSLTPEQAQALHWLARHLCFEDALQATPPHIGKDQRTERAYGIVQAAAALEIQIREAGQHGDRWMYRGVRP